MSDRRGLFASVFLVTLAIRCLFVFQWTQTPYATMPLLDAKVYHEWAQAIAAGDFLRGKAFYQSPLYPYFLGLIYALFGEHFALVGVINALFEATTATLLAALTLALFESRAGALIAAGLFAFYRSAIFYTAPVMKEPLGLLLETAFLYVLYRAFQRPKVRSFFISGLLLGLAALVRGNFLCLAPIVLLYGFFLFRKSFSVKACFFVLGLMLAVAPATLHNYLVSGDFVLTNYTDGFNLYIGNSPYANGTNAYPPEVSTDPVQEELNTIWVATDELGRALSPSEVSSYWRS
ncbi:MAG: glycosyltransferase family 39 protein, partial [Bdellovibrionales bacterium]